jgi:hypothetical protein
MLGWPQPSATIDDIGLEVCLPDRGCQRFGWDEIDRLLPETLSRRRQLTTRNPGFDLYAPDGRVLATLPYYIAFPAGIRWRGDRRAFAEHVVERHPERFALLKPGGLRMPFLTFGRVGEGLSPIEIAAINRRHRLLRWLELGALSVLAIAGFIIVTFHPVW